MASPRQKMGRARDNAGRCRKRAGKASNRWRLKMRKIKIIEQISLDGVIQAPGGRDEDGDYPHGGWAMPYFDTDIGEAIVAAQGRSFDLLLGRRTYDIFAGYWPKAENGPIADGLNAATKYVA